MSAIPVLAKLRQECCCELKVSLAYLWSVPDYSGINYETLSQKEKKNPKSTKQKQNRKIRCSLPMVLPVIKGLLKGYSVFGST